MTNFVLLHGAWHGGWCWARVAPLLRARGHQVLTPTQTGLGERAHLLHAGITVETFVQDLLGVLHAEELEDAVLVGHSFGGIAITGAADRTPERVRSLIYLDSRILENGESALDQATPEQATARHAAAAESGGVSVPPPPPSDFGVPDGPDADWLARRMTPHPFSTMTSRLRLANPVGNGLPCAYVACTTPKYGPLEPARRWARNRPGWRWREMATGHNAMVTAPGPLADLLEELA